jgi:multimeric flavodoxin WrbA
MGFLCGRVPADRVTGRGDPVNVVTVFASPRPKGNTNRILDWVERALEDGKHAVERIHLNPLEIKDCAACLACAESPDEPGCALHDDVPGVFERILAADAVVFASPLYMWGITGPLKMLFDRSLCLVRGREHRNTDRSSTPRGPSN